MTPILTQSNINSNQTFGLTIDRYPNEFNTSYIDFLYFNLKLAKSKKTQKITYNDVDINPMFTTIIPRPWCKGEILM